MVTMRERVSASLPAGWCLRVKGKAPCVDYEVASRGEEIRAWFNFRGWGSLEVDFFGVRVTKSQLAAEFERQPRMYGDAGERERWVRWLIRALEQRGKIKGMLLKDAKIKVEAAKKNLKLSMRELDRRRQVLARAEKELG